MFEVAVFAVFILLPFGFGYWTRSYVSLLLPLALVVLCFAGYVTATETRDEVDVQPGIFLVGSFIAVVVCGLGVYAAQRDTTQSIR